MRNETAFASSKLVIAVFAGLCMVSGPLMESGTSMRAYVVRACKEPTRMGVIDKHVLIINRAVKDAQPTGYDLCGLFVISISGGYNGRH